jgi:hypothetical protein
LIINGLPEFTQPIIERLVVRNIEGTCSAQAAALMPEVRGTFMN